MKSQSQPQVFDSAGLVPLGKELGRGGEGAVYEVSGRTELVAKIYHKQVAPEKALKIQTMAALKSERLLTFTAWPLDLLKSSQGAPCGLLMPKITGHKDIHTLYSPKSRKNEFPNADWRFLLRVAANTCRAFGLIHDLGCVIGDVNHGGVTVSSQATVKLIDCDSFQVQAAGRRFLCEVGVPTFTPPELQGQAFRGVVRSPNHDAFGLAVLIFQLLFMGRHPFSGRFSGQGEMPIEKAIHEFRFAYGSTSAAMLMQPPPGAAALAIVSTAAQLFERAFSPSVVHNGGRPSAKEWLTALEALEGQLRECRINGSHYFFRGLQSCPWCQIEATTGAVLFNIYVRQTSTGFDIAAVWGKIQSIQAPGPPLTLKQRADFGSVSPSPAANQVSVEQSRYMWTGLWVCALTTLVLCVGLPGSAIMWLIGGGVCGGAFCWLVREGPPRRFNASHRSARADYRSAVERWERSPSADQQLQQKLQQLEALRKDWHEIPTRRQSRYRQLEANRESQQLAWFLDKHEIDKAHIAGIGPGRKATLESFNIETAWDCTRENIQQVPGFGPAMTQKLLNWRWSIEEQFRFDPTQGVDPRDIAALDREMADARRKLEDELTKGVTELAQIRGQNRTSRSALKYQADQALGVLIKAEVDRAAALRLRSPRESLTMATFGIPLIVAVVACATIGFARTRTIAVSAPMAQLSVATAVPTTAPDNSIKETTPKLAAEAYAVEAAYVQTELANVRRNPSMRGPVVRRLKRGEQVLIKTSSEEWKAIIDPLDRNQVIGWIHRNVIGSEIQR